MLQTDTRNIFVFAHRFGFVLAVRLHLILLRAKVNNCTDMVFYCRVKNTRHTFLAENTTYNILV